MLVPDGRASLLLVVSTKWRRHLRVTVVGDVVRSWRELLVVIVELLLVVVMRLRLGHHIVLLVRYMNCLCRECVSIVIAVRWRELWMCNKLMMLMESRKLHG